MNSTERTILETAIASLTKECDIYKKPWHWLQKDKSVIYASFLSDSYEFCKTMPGVEPAISLRAGTFTTAAEALQTLRVEIKKADIPADRKKRLLLSLRGASLPDFPKFGTPVWINRYGQLNDAVDFALGEIQYQAAILRFGISKLDLISTFAQDPEAAKKMKLIYEIWCKKQVAEFEKANRDDEELKEVDAKSGEKEEPKADIEAAAILTELGKDLDIPTTSTYPTVELPVFQSHPTTVMEILLTRKPKEVFRVAPAVGTYDKASGQVIRASQQLLKNRQTSAKSVQQLIENNKAAMYDLESANQGYHQQLEKINAGSVTDEICAAMLSGFWTDPLVQDGLLWFRTAAPLIIQERSKEAGVDTTINLGYFAVVIDSGNNVSVYPCGDNRRSVGGRGVYHPHIDENGKPCLADSLGDFQTAVRAGDLPGMLLPIQSALSAYNAGSPYAKLDEFTKIVPPSHSTPYGNEGDVKPVELEE